MNESTGRRAVGLLEKMLHHGEWYTSDGEKLHAEALAIVAARDAEALSSIPRWEATVFGTAQPQGSMRGFVVGGKARLTSDNKKLDPWRQAIYAIVSRIPTLELELGPVELHVTFYLPAPKVKEAAMLRKGIVLPHLSKPDTDKLLRGVKDALKMAGAYRDDSQVTDVVARKRYARPGERPRATISLWSER